MKILLIYPEYPDTFWSFKHALKFISKKAVLPPLGLLTIASLLPQEFKKKLIDMNVAKLTDKDLLNADYVFISAMITQRESTHKLVERCKKLGVKTVAGGPLFSSLYNEFPEIDHFILNEGEVTLPLFLEDLENGNPKRVYTSDIKPDITQSPVPQWNLINFKDYLKIPIQYSRGCPFDCEFCDIVNLNGKIPRTKEPQQVIQELDALYDKGWRGSIFIVDDNFIGDKPKTKELLKILIEWQKSKKYRPVFMTEASLNLAEDEELMSLMRDAGFNSVFIGLETPSAEALKECGKHHNKNKDLVAAVRKIHSYGMEVAAGFIVGFDSDDTSIFRRQIEFIQETGVVVAMIGLLQALPGTRLYKRLKEEGRIIDNASGNNTDFSINFLPKIDTEVLINGYRDIVSTVYSAKTYYERIQRFLKDYKSYGREKLSFKYFIAMLRSMWEIGLFESGRRYYWKLFFLSLFKYPKSFSKFITFTIYHAHFRKIFPELSSNPE